MDTWLSNAMRVINLMPNLEEKKLVKIFGSSENILEVKVKTIEELASRFELAMTRGVALFGKHAFRKSLPINNTRRTPINKALFETWGNILAGLNQENFDILIKNKNLLMASYYILLNGNNTMKEMINPFSMMDLDFLREHNTSNDKVDYFQIIQGLAFFVFGREIAHVTLPNLRNAALTVENNEEEEIAGNLYVLLNGDIGESLYFSISHNASKVESVKNRYFYLGNLVRNIIRGKKSD
jgi:hypothetical protein